MQKSIRPILDDKDLVIIAVTIISIVAMFYLSNPTTIISSCISGLFGIAVGRKK